MITETIIQMFMGAFQLVFNVFPNFPAMPSIVIDGWEWFLDISNSGTGIIAYLLSTPLYYAALGLILFMTTFEYVYQFAIRFLVFRVFMGFVGR